MSTRLAPLLLATSFAATAAAEEPWKPYANRDGFQIDLRDVPGSGFQEIRVTTTVDAPLDRLCDSVFAKVVGAKLERPFKKSEVIRATDTDRWLYEQISVPLVSDRDYVIHLTLDRPASSGSCEISFHTEEDRSHPPLSDLVRVPLIHGHWRLVPREDGRVSLTYEVYGEPGGNIPAFMARGSQRDTAVEFVHTIIARARVPRQTAP